MLVYSILSVTPIWALFGILFALTFGAIFVGRHIFEGVPYQVSYSAQVGDAALLMAVLIAATILQRGNAVIPAWAPRLSVVIAGIALFIGIVVCVSTLTSRGGKLMDIYHDVVIAPIVMYFAITLLPVIYQNGTALEQGATWFAIAFWMICVIYDVHDDRMNQRRLLERMGLKFPD